MIFRWRGAYSTSMQDGRNWINEAGTVYASGVYPGLVANVDEIVFDAAITTYAPTASCDFSAKEVIKSMTVGELFASDIGASGGYFKGVVLSTYINAPLAGNIYLYGSGSGAGLSDILLMDSGSTKTVYLAGIMTSPKYLKGNISIAASSEIKTSVLFGYVSSVNSDLTGVIAASVTLPSEVIQTGGSIVNSNAITLLSQSGGIWTQVTGDITTHQGDAGTLYWTAGNITTSILVAGTLDGSESQTPRRIGTVVVYSQGTLILDNGVGNIYVTNYIQNFGGTISYPNGMKIGKVGTETISVGVPPQNINNTNVDGNILYLGLYDMLEVICVMGAVHDSAVLKFEIFEDSVAAMNSPATEIAAYHTDVTETTDDNTTFTLTVWGYNLTTGKNYCRVKVTNGAAQDAYVSVVYRLLTN